MAYSVSSIRGSLARTMYSKLMEDVYDSRRNHFQWYAVNLDKISVNKLTFIQLSEDPETSEFLDTCRKKSDWIFTQLMHSFLKFVLTFFMSSTSANGLLSRGSMFVMSSSQFEQLTGIKESEQLDSLLDLGAGDGAVTEKFSKYFKNVFVTEKSTTMSWRLEERGYKVLDPDTWHKNSSGGYDIISCLNLLDRCDKPLDLLEMIHGQLRKETGRLLVAVVLPLSQYVESGDCNHIPNQQLHVNGCTFEQHLSSLVNDVFLPAGYELEKYSKVPYLCEGDLHHSYYVLYDAVLLLRSLQS